MAEELKGGQQFFSNYLKSFKETVDKQTEIVGKIDAVLAKMNELVPKFAMPSSAYKGTIGVDGTIKSKEVTMFINGSIRIKVTGKGLKTGTNDVAVKDGDVVYINLTSSTTGGKYYGVYVNGVKSGTDILIVGEGTESEISKIEVGFTLIDKPNFS